MHLIGIQETRYSPTNPISKQGSYIVIAGPDDAGHLGCQLWLNADAAIATDGEEQIHFDTKCISIIRAEPRLLVVLVDLGKNSLACIVGHSPTSATDYDTILAWWSRLDSAIRAIPAKFRPILFLDANARFGDEDAHVPAARPLTTPAKFLQALLADRELTCTPLRDRSGNKAITWTSPMQRGACLDYIIVPRDLGKGLTTSGAWSDFPSIHGPDHFPLIARLHWQDLGKASRVHVAVDRQAMLTSAGREKIRQIFSTAPQLPWGVHADDYLATLNKHISQSLVEAFPKQTKGPRQLHVSESSWKWIQFRRKLRRQMHQAGQQQRRAFLRACWAAWARPATRQGRLKNTWHMLQARLGKLVRTAHCQIRAHMRQDTANHARQCMQEAKKDGPGALAAHLRSILRIGRSYKPTRAAPSLQINGELVAGQKDVGHAFALHFAKAERAQLCSREDLQGKHAAVHTGPGEDIQPDQVPTLVDLASRFARLQPHKASGFSLIPAEAFRAAPMEAAKLHMPLLLRMAMGREPPFLWVGGRCVPIPKPNKPPLDLSGWRSVMLLEPACKAVGQAFRPDIVQQFVNKAAPVQCGAQKGVPISLPMLHIRTHLSMLEKRKQSGAILFVDATNAYYSIIRHFLFAHGDICGHDALLAAVERIHPQPDMQRQLLAALAGPGLMQDAPAPVKHYVRSVLAHAWFSTDAQADQLCATCTGTSPGAPLADVLFQIIFTTALQSIQHQLRENGLEVTAGIGAAAPLPTWADDLAIPCASSSASEVLPQVVQVASITHKAMHSVGLDMNFAPGKSEALIVWRGAEAGKLRQSHFSRPDPHVEVPIAGDKIAKLTLTRSYVHLGGIVNDINTYREDIDHRRVHANLAFDRLKRTLLYNPDLTASEKSQLFSGLVLGRFMHGIGQWRLSNNDEAYLCSTIQKWQRSMVRPLVGATSKGLTAAQVCEVTGCLPAETLLHAARLAQLVMVVENGDGYLWKALLVAQDWIRDAICSLKIAVNATKKAISIPEDESQIFIHLQEHLPALRLLPGQYKAHTAKTLAQNRQQVKEKIEFLACLEAQGGCVFTIEHRQAQSTRFCPECGIGCRTEAALASHRSRRHDVGGRVSNVQGTYCAVCRGEFWTTPCLRMHLRKAETCAEAHLASDVSYGPREFTENKALVRRPACKALGPQPFWATMRPTAVARAVRSREDPPVQPSKLWEFLSKHSRTASDFFATTVRMLLRISEVPDVEDILEHCTIGRAQGTLKIRLLADLLSLSVRIVQRYRLGESGCETIGSFVSVLQGQTVSLRAAGGSG